MIEHQDKQKKFSAFVIDILVMSEFRNSAHADHYSVDEYVENRVSEARGLALAIDLDIKWNKSYKLKTIHSATFLGKGKLEEISEQCVELEPDVVIFNNDLSPGQQRNIERALNCKVIDRTGLILEIFGERAQSKEGKLQVELASLQFQRTRLVKAWTHLERQRGGAGFMGGPGETQIELDRRIIDDKITKLKCSLENVIKIRRTQRESREKVPFPVVSLIGYTNAGKSTLFNNITNAGVFAEDLLFATLDPTMRRVKIPGFCDDIILSDTVGFISDLPTTLIAAFKATLEQVIFSNVILHVRDVSSPYYEMQKDDVINVMSELSVDYESDDRIIEVWNKIDLLNEENREIIENKAKSKDNVVLVSSVSGEGIENLYELISNHFLKSMNKYEIKIPYKMGKAISWLYDNSNIDVINEETDNMVFLTSLSDADFGRFNQLFDDVDVSLIRSRHKKTGS